MVPGQILQDDVAIAMWNMKMLASKGMTPSCAKLGMAREHPHK